MSAARVRLLVLPLICAALSAGCGKRVELTFVNLTGDSLDVHVTSARQGRQYLGVIATMGKLSHDLVIEKQDLPATCAWSAGPYSEQFTVTKDTPDKLWIDLTPLEHPRVGEGQAGPDEEIKTPTAPSPPRGPDGPDFD